METPLYIGIGIGTIGAIHCLGMCGPLVFALPVNNYKPAKRCFYIFLYHIARVSVYLLLALVLASFGNALWRAGFFNMFSIALGSLILLYKLLSISKKTRRFTDSMVYRFFLKKTVSLLGNKNKTGQTFWLLGSLNGLLPCGLVYTALNATFLYQNPMDAMLLMLGFGVATIPLLVMLRLVKTRVPKFISSKWSYIQSLILIMVACMLIFRGLKIDIPTLMPRVKETFRCH